MRIIQQREIQNTEAKFQGREVGRQRTGTLCTLNAQRADKDGERRDSNKQ